VINHFYVSGMGINRNDNPSLREFKMITKKKNWIDFISKETSGLEESKD
jgi:hypothetical protein